MVLSVKVAVAEFLPVAEKARNVELDAEKGVRSLQMKFPVLNYRKSLFDGPMNAVDKELATARLKCATLRWNRNEVPSELKTVETDLGKFLKVVSERTTKGSSMISEQFKGEVAIGLEKISRISSMRQLRFLVSRRRLCRSPLWVHSGRS